MTAQRILIVDDEPLNRDYLEQELADLGYEVHTAADGPQALRQVAADPPDLILLDVVMPGMDGIEVCRRLKDDPETRLIPIIIMTALTAREDRIRGVAAGADDFLIKPVDEQELHGRISGALRLKAAIDRKLTELESASRRIVQLGKHDEDLAVVVAMTDGDGAGHLASMLEDAGGVVADVPAAPVAVVFRGADPIARARAAADAVRGSATDIAVGIAVGSALIGSERTDIGDQRRWVLTAEGPAVAQAVQAAAAASPGQVLVGQPVLDQLGTAYPASVAASADGMALFDLARRQRGDGASPFELAFPVEFADLLPVLKQRWQVTEVYLTRALSGLSGARVYAVDIECAGHSGQAILKLERLTDPTWNEEQEADRHRHAVGRDEAYATAHLPKVLHVVRHDDAVAILSTIAAGGLEYCLAWFRAPYERQLEAGPRIMRDILESWNGGYHLAPGLRSPSELLDRWLAYRLDPQEGRLHTLLADDLGIDPLVPTFLLAGHWYPNPLAFARGAEGIPAAPPLRAAVGQTHGDLHGFNVLTSHRRTDVSDYFLIDLAFYEDDSFLLFDQAYFELAYLLRTREDATVGRWIDLLAGIFRGDATNADDVGVIRLVDAIRAGALDWIHDHEDHRLSYMVSQLLVGRVGAGLNFANKRIAVDLKVKALLYAAAALKQYVKMHELDWPRAGQVVTLRPTSPHHAPS